MREESLTVVPSEYQEKLRGKRLFWGQVTQTVFRVLGNTVIDGRKLKPQVSDTGTQYYEADFLASLDPYSIPDAPHGSIYDPAELAHALMILAEVKSYRHEAFDTSLLEPEVVQALEGKWLFRSKVLERKINLMFLNNVLERCKAAEAKLRKKILVTVGSMQYINAAELAKLSPRFFELELFPVASLDNLREKLLELLDEDQIRVEELRAFAEKKDLYTRKASEGFLNVSEQIELEVKGEAQELFNAILEQINQLEAPELKLIHIRIQITKYMLDLDTFVTFSKVAFTYQMLSLLTQFTEELLGEVFSE